jgi:hypothetical protein
MIHQRMSASRSSRKDEQTVNPQVFLPYVMAFVVCMQGVGRISQWIFMHPSRASNAYKDREKTTSYINQTEIYANNNCGL